MAMNTTEVTIARVNFRSHWRLFLIEGIILAILGVLAIAIPPIATLAATIFFGWMLLLVGIIGLFTSFMARRAPGFAWSLLSAVVSIIAGLILVGWPVSGAVSLTLVMTFFFVVEGVASLMYAIEHRRELSGRWGWMAFSGVIDLLLAAIIIAGLPGTAIWAIGLLLGINLLFGGIALIAMALHARA